MSQETKCFLQLYKVHVINVNLLHKQRSPTNDQASPNTPESQHKNLSETSDSVRYKTSGAATDLKAALKLNYVDVSIQTDPQLDPLSQWSPVSNQRRQVFQILSIDLLNRWLHYSNNRLLEMVGYLNNRYCLFYGISNVLVLSSSE